MSEEREIARRHLEARVTAAIEASLREPLERAAWNEIALAIHAFQLAHNAPYAAFARALGGGPPTDWRSIPAVPQSAFKRADLRTFSAAETQLTFYTSGTTGEGFGRHHFRSPDLYESSLRAAWRFAGLPVGRPHWILIPPASEALHSSLSHMMGALAPLASEQNWLAHRRDDALALDVTGLRDAAALAREPVILLGTALAFLALFEQLGERTMTLPAGSLAFETGGYKGSGREIAKDELYALFTRHFGLAPESVWNEYGMTELSTQAYANGLGGPHRPPPWLRALVIDPESGAEVAGGEVGLVRLFDLANVGSALAVQTQDLAVRRDGGTFELIGRDPRALPRGCSRAADELLQIRP